MNVARLLSASVRVTDAGRAYLTELKKMMVFQATGRRSGADPEKLSAALVSLESAVEEAEELREAMLQKHDIVCQRLRDAIELVETSSD